MLSTLGKFLPGFALYPFIGAFNAATSPRLSAISRIAFTFFMLTIGLALFYAPFVSVVLWHLNDFGELELFCVNRLLGLVFFAYLLAQSLLCLNQSCFRSMFDVVVNLCLVFCR